MNRKKLVDVIGITLLSGFIIIALICIDDVKDSVVRAIKSSVYTVIPSLFVICTLSTAIANSGAITRCIHIKGVNTAILAALILGNIGGYPIGAKILKDMTDRGMITKEDARYACSFCFAAGPGFCLGILSSTVFKSKMLGLISFISVLAANICIYSAYLFINRNRVSMCAIEDNNTETLTDCITKSVQSSAYAMLSVGSSIVFFSAVISILNFVIPSFSNIKWLSSCFEISNTTAMNCNDAVSFSLICILIAFGGICVHMQVASLVSGAYPLDFFYMTRPIHMLLTSIFSFFAYIITQRYLPASISPKSISISEAQSILPFICMLGIIAISIYHLSDRKAKR